MEDRTIIFEKFRGGQVPFQDQAITRGPLTRPPSWLRNPIEAEMMSHLIGSRCRARSRRVRSEEVI